MIRDGKYREIHKRNKDNGTEKCKEIHARYR
jgi:hypothetical protein